MSNDKDARFTGFRNEWLVMNAIGYPVSLVVGGAVFAGFTRRSSYDNNAPSVLIQAVIFSFTVWALLGFIQWLVLKDYFDAAAWWIIGSGLGGLLIGVLAGALSPIFAWLLAGAVVGFCQWLAGWHSRGSTGRSEVVNELPSWLLRSTGAVALLGTIVAVLFFATQLAFGSSIGFLSIPCAIISLPISGLFYGLLTVNSFKRLL